MKKTVRVCDGCGDKIIAGEWANCAVCDKDICRACAGEMELWLCPTHFKQVQEFIEGLKEPVTIHAYDNLCWYKVGGRKDYGVDSGRGKVRARGVVAASVRGA